jgi:carboxyl-terminal processing protease
MFLELAAVAALVAGPQDAVATGVWRSQGYGYVLDVGDTGVRIYDITASSCALSGEAPGLEALGAIEGLDAERFVLAGDTSRIGFERIAALPAPCQTPEPPSADPLRTFDVLWETFDENYPFFALRGVDWEAVRERYRPRVAALGPQGDPWPVLVEILGRFQDAHVRLIDGDRRFQVRRTASGPSAAELQRGLIEYLGRPDGALAGGVALSAHDRLAYGRTPEGAAYLAVMTMGGFSNGPDGWPGNTTSEADVAAARLALNDALAGFEGAPGLILDLRFNPGGSEAISTVIAGCFADRKRLAYTRAGRDGDRMGPAFETYAEPGDCRRFLKPVVVLTGERTTSAAEALVMRLRVLPQVTVMGQPTQGAHSDVLSRTLPNGWELGLSNEVYTLADGQVYEGVGIPPAEPTPAAAPEASPEARYGADIRRAARRLLAGAGERAALHSPAGPRRDEERGS